jgi:4-hydroxy-3-methylbut-2-enyl diphosphate reductase
LIGHAGHPEVIGTLGRYHHEYGGSIYLVQTVEDVAKLEVNEPGNLAFVTQTTLSVDDTKQVIAALKERFPNIVGPRKDDICYATQNRQMAVRRLAAEVDVLIVVGARNSSNSNRLREVGENSGLSAYLVQEAEDIDSNWFSAGARVGLTAGASAPEILVEEVLERLSNLGIADVQELDAEPEGVNFPIPSDLVKLRQHAQASKAAAPIG